MGGVSKDMRLMKKRIILIIVTGIGLALFLGLCIYTPSTNSQYVDKGKCINTYNCLISCIIVYIYNTSPILSVIY